MNDSPVVIGGMGGSGTTLIASIIQLLGYDLGKANGFNDAHSFIWFYEAWLPYYLSGKYDHSGMAGEFRDCLANHKKTIKNKDRWGWKNPRTYLMVPFLVEMVPGLKFIHIIRDGRDMALSGNIQQVTRYADNFLIPQYLTVEEKAIQYWVESNLRTYIWAHQEKFYLPILYEDVCRDPIELACIIADFLNVAPFPSPDEITNLVKPPDSLGRWRQLPETEQKALTRLGQPALHIFGYTSIED